SFRETPSCVANTMPFSIRTPGSADAGEASAESTTSASAIVTNTGLRSRWFLITPVLSRASPFTVRRGEDDRPILRLSRSAPGGEQWLGGACPGAPPGTADPSLQRPAQAGEPFHTDEPSE